MAIASLRRSAWAPPLLALAFLALVGLSSVLLRGARIDATLWTTAACRGARIAVAQALAYAVANGLDVSGE